LKRAILITLLLTTSATTQDSSLVQGFAEGFTFNSHFGASPRIDRDGAVIYARDGGTNTHIARAVRRHALRVPSRLPPSN
jgi:hypothetical protein